jgi:serine/threonine protein kinase
MTPERWRHIKHLCDRALALPREARQSFLDDACKGDEAVRRDIESLLAQASELSKFLERPAIDAMNNASSTEATTISEAADEHLAGLQDGRTFGPYRIARLLGRGGMGEVYEAEEMESGRRVAIKVLLRSRLDSVSRARFFREGRLAASVAHPHVVYVFSTSEIDGIPVIAMELATRGTLKNRVQTQGLLPPAEAVDAMLDVIAGLEAMASAGVLHRDLKPSNCFVDRDGQVKVGDFGLSISTLSRGETATLTESGSFFGTPAFAAPEQLRGEALDVRSDIYAVGATLFYLLTGRTPIEETNLIRLVARIGDEPPPSPRTFNSATPPGLADVVLQCLAKRPADRFQRYRDLVAALAPYRGGGLATARIVPRLVAGALDFSAIGLAATLLTPFTRSLETTARSILPVSTWTPILPVIVLLYALIQAFICGAYFGLTEGIWSRSPGKRVCGLRVVMLDGGAATIRRKLARSSIFASCLWLAMLPSPLLLIPLSPNLRVMIELMTAASFVIFLRGMPPLLLLSIFAFARRRNSYAGLHDWLTRTRVVEERSEIHLAAPIHHPSVRLEAETPRIGPYAVVTSAETAVPHGLIAGYDVDLARPVWIERRQPGSPPVTPQRRDLDRPARLRWLAGVRTETDAWDAYEAVVGQPLTSLSAQPWSRVRHWLRELSDELAAASRYDAPPELSLQCVWIGVDGRARLLEWPAAPAPETRQDFVAEIDSASAQRFLVLVAKSALEGRYPIADPDGLPRVRPPLPLPAATLLRAARDGRFSNARALADGVASLVAQAPAASRSRRTAHLAICAMCAVVLAGAALKSVGTRRAFRPGRTANDLRQFAETVNLLLQYDRWERQSATPLIVQRRQALEVYIRGNFRRTLREAAATAEPVPLPLQDGPLLRRAEGVLRGPIPSRDEVAQAGAVLQSLLEPRKSMVPRVSGEAVSATSSRVGLVVVILGLIGSVLAPMFFRGGLLMHALGLAVVTESGVEVSRVRALCRALLAWTPGYLYVLLAAQRTDLLTPVQRAIPTIAITTPTSLPMSGAPAVGLWVLALGAFYAAYRPTRGLQDFLTGTWLVPR